MSDIGGPRDARGLGMFQIPWPITADDEIEARQAIAAAQRAGEGLREQVLSSYSPGRALLPHGLNRPVATVAENLAVAAMKLDLSRLDTSQGRDDPELRALVARYNEAAAAFADTWELVKLEDWTTLRARYGSLRRDAAPGCLSIFAILAMLVGALVCLA